VLIRKRSATVVERKAVPGSRAVSQPAVTWTACWLRALLLRSAQSEHSAHVRPRRVWLSSRGEMTALVDLVEYK
jgi:hypothetical protein